MEVSFEDNIYDRLETDRDYDAGFPKAVVSAYRKKVRFLRAARDLRDVAAMQSIAKIPETKEPIKAFFIPLGDGYVLEVGLRTRSMQTACSIRRIQPNKKKDPKGTQ